MTTTDPEATQPPQQQQPTADDDRKEFVVRRQSLGELHHVGDALHSPIAATRVESASAVQQLANIDEGKLRQKDRSHSGSRSMVTTEFSHQFELVDTLDIAGAQDDGGVEDRVPISSAWSQEAMARQESNADNVLVETRPALSAAEQQLQQPQDERDEAQVLEQGANELTRDAFNVAIQRVSGADSEPIPLSQAAIRAVEVITIDILKRFLRDDLRNLEASYSGSKCGPGQIKLASIIVHRALNSASSKVTTWSEKALQAASVLIEDVLSSAIVYINRGADATKRDHMWSREAIQISCLIVHDVLADAAQKASMGEQPDRPSQQQTSHSQTADSPDEDQPPTAAQPTSGLVADDAMDNAAQQQTSQSPTSYSQHEDRVGHTETAADQDGVIEQPSPAPQQRAASPATSEISSACDCCYDRDSVFNDSIDSSEQ